MNSEVTTAPATEQVVRTGLGFGFTWTKGRIALAAVTALGFVLAVIRFAIGLGPTTNLTDAWPWGLWIGFNVLSGVALSGGAFSLAAIVYIFNVKRFRHLTRSAVLAGFLGYITVIFSLLVELGRPYRVWHPWIMWQHESVMFEVAWCVTLYATVLTLEFAPVLCERLGWQKWEVRLHKALIPLVIAGIVLSTLHQSSLGTMFLIMPEKISPLWYSAWLPLFAFLTSIGAGLATLALVYTGASRSFKRVPDNGLLTSLTKAVPFAYIPYLVIRLVDLTMRGAWTTAFQPSAVSAAFWVELLLGMVVPAVLLIFTAVRRSALWRNICLWLTVAGLVLNRMGVSIIGMADAIPQPYFPSFSELLITAGIWTGAALVFLFLAENSRVLPEDVQ